MYKLLPLYVAIMLYIDNGVLSYLILILDIDVYLNGSELILNCISSV